MHMKAREMMIILLSFHQAVWAHRHAFTQFYKEGFLYASLCDETLPKWDSTINRKNSLLQELT